jgi:hypothetical protein
MFPGAATLRASVTSRVVCRTESLPSHSAMPLTRFCHVFIPLSGLTRAARELLRRVAGAMRMSPDIKFCRESRHEVLPFTDHLPPCVDA